MSIAALGYAAYCYFMPAQTSRSTVGGRPRLGASNAADGTNEMGSMFNGISVFIWGLVLTKARQGMEAANTKDSEKAGGLLKKSAGLIFMIVAASVFQLLSSFKYEVSPTQVASQVATHALQSSRGQAQEHPDSYYDQSSSHYMGGAHNVALANIRSGLQPRVESGHTASYYDKSSPHYLGGAHNVALQ